MGAPSRRDRLRPRAGLGLGLASCLFVVAVGQAHGAYFSTAWGWCVLVFASVTGLALTTSGRLAFGRLELGFLSSLALLVAWMALSIVWSSDVEQSVLEVQRALVYLVGVLAALLVVRRRSIPHLLAGLLAGISVLSAYGLASRLFPAGAAFEEIVLNRLAAPLGYANALGLICTMGVLLALGFAAHGRSLAGRMAAAAMVPVLLTAAYFTYSRGAALALAVGLLAAVALERRRLAFVTVSLLVALPSGASVWLASRAPGLTEARATQAVVADEGGRLAIVLLALAIGSAALVMLFTVIERRAHFPRPVSRVYGGLLLCIAIALVAGTVAQYGGPISLAKDSYRSFNSEAPVTPAGPVNLNRRLVSLSNTERVQYWRVARRQHAQHRWLGSGAGTYEQFWLRHRPVGAQVRDAHSLYLETLAQLGWVGLILVVAMLALPLAGALRARDHPLVAGAFGAYVAYVVHTGVDWHWEMPVVTLLALWCGVALIAGGGGAAARCAMPTGWRALGVVATLAVAVFSAIGLIGNRALAEAADKVDIGAFSAGEAAAEKAVRWAPWSAEAHQQLGRARAGLGRRAEGRASLLEATRKNPRDWRIWYDLGIASSGPQRQRAFVRAATLNPLEEDIQVLREQGYRLPPARAPG